MNALCFVDTNVLVYFRDASNPEKQQRASTWFHVFWQSRTGRISFQVLNEYYIAVTEKLVPGLSREDARSDIRDLMSWSPIRLDYSVLKSGWNLQDRYGYSWWDALIIGAAKKARAQYIVTEDLQSGQSIDDLTIINPFESDPDDL